MLNKQESRYFARNPGRKQFPKPFQKEIAPTEHYRMASEDRTTYCRTRWANYYGAAVPTLVSTRELCDAMPKAFAGVERQLRNLLDTGLPYADTAWAIGQALHKQVPWSSGPVSLWLAGRFADAIGFFAVWWSRYKGAWPEHAHAAFTQIGRLRDIAAETVFDREPHLFQTYAQMHAATEDEPQRFEAFRVAMRPLVPEEDEIRFEQRDLARDAWTLPASVVRGFDDAWNGWWTFRKKHKPRSLPLEHHAGFRAAFRIAGSAEFSVAETEQYAFNALASVFSTNLRYALEAKPKPTKPRPSHDELKQKYGIG